MKIYPTKLVNNLASHVPDVFEKIARGEKNHS